MNFVAQLEELLRDLGAESRKKHPGVKEASERAILKLRTLQNAYVSAVRKANSGEKHPDTSLFRSSDLLHPFLLAANYPNASPKLLDTSFRAMKILMEANAICPGDGMNMVRVWMIQAQVVVSYSMKESSSNNSSIPATKLVATDQTTSSANQSNNNGTQSTGWFGGLSSSILSSAPAANSIKTTNSVSTKTSVSSSHGQAGSGRLNAKDLEKLALDIMSCLLQLLELRDLPVTTEQWVQSITLCCLLYLPLRQTVRQAAHSTLPQVLTLLVRDERALPLAIQTWDDLLACTVGWDNDKKCNLQGGFRQCHRLGEKDSPQPPSPALSLELMTTLLREAPDIFSKVGQKSLGVTVQVLLKQSTKKSESDNAAEPREFLRAVQFALVVIQTQAKEWPTECQELIARLIQPIPNATEALRQQADFEDGYVYNVSNKNLSVTTITKLNTLEGLPPASLWKSALSLETLESLIQDKTLRHIWIHPDVVVPLLEAISDFCTIGASCEEHINLLILASRQKEHELVYSAESLSSLGLWKSGKNKDERYILGDALWIGLNLILRIIDMLDESVLEASFAPGLAVLQHYLKRLPASGIIVKRALEGYFSLAKVSLKVPLLRRVLLSSLCKLSLPKWGTLDPSCSLKDHNIAALICLLNVIHRFHNNIESEWSIVIQTFQDESLINFVKGLKEVAILDQTSNMITSPVRGAEVLRVPTKPKENLGKDEKGTIGEKLMNIGVRAIYGGNEPQIEDIPLTERTKNTYYHDYQLEFSRRVRSSKHPVRVGVPPFSLSLLADVAMVNTFRHKQCGALILHQLCALAADSPSTRHFSMDMVTMIIISHVTQTNIFPAAFQGPGKIVYQDPRQNQYLAVEQIKNQNSDDISPISQVDLFGPLCECICNAKISSVAESCLEALHALLESSGHELDSEAWNEIIQAVTSIPSDNRSSADWSESCLIGFRCLKLIVDDFLNESSSFSPVRTSLLHCCSLFGSSRHDVNTSLTAIGLLWTIADQDAGTTSIDLALSKLVILSSDTRAEVRNCSVNTLFSCIVGRGQAFTEIQWKACISNIILGVYDLVTEKSGTGEGGLSQTKEETPSKSRYRVSVHHSRDSAGKQWMSTQALVLRGLARVLRIFFSHLLDTTDDGSGSGEQKNETPWFEKAWNTILGHAFDASTQTGGRDTLELRSAGVELLVLCNQLACRAGIQAAITPARVGTNMEVVNGALRSVRSPDKVSSNKDSLQRSHSIVTEMWRENLFLDSFDVLDSFREFLENDSSADKESGLSPYMEPTQVQVLSKFALDLNKLYDCCSGDEFVEDKTFDKCTSFEKELGNVPVTVDEEDTLVARFVRIVMTVAFKSSGGPDSRFLSQAQRSCIDLLRSMASNGSPEALVNLSFLSKQAFFRERESNGKPKKGVDVLSHEASTVLFEELPNENVSDECRVLVLCRLVSMETDSSLTKDKSHDNELSYKLLVPLMEPCLKSASIIERSLHDAKTESVAKVQLLDGLWEKLCIALGRMLPSLSESKSLTTPHADDLVDLVRIMPQYVHTKHSSELSSILCAWALGSLESFGDLLDGQEKILQLFAACFAGVCCLQPQESRLSLIADRVLSAAQDSISPNNDESSKSHDLRKHLNIQACVLVCQVMQETSGIERVVIAVFPKLCEMVSVQDPQLRQSIGGLLAKVNVGKVLEDTQNRCERAENRAEVAEERVGELSLELEKLEREKQALEQQLGFLG